MEKKMIRWIEAREEQQEWSEKWTHGLVVVAVVVRDHPQAGAIKTGRSYPT